MERRGRKKKLTQEQIDWRNSILRGRVKTINIAKAPPVSDLDNDKLRQCFYYLDNCVFWINEYIDGRVDRKRLLETARSIKMNAENLEAVLLVRLKTN